MENFEIELISRHQIRITDGDHQQAILTADKKGNVGYKEVKTFTIDKNLESQLAPFRWVDHGDSVSLCHDVSQFRDEIFASAPDYDYFTVKGGGHDWEFLAQLFIDEHMPELRKDIYFDSESGMFCAYSENAESLQYFALEFRKTFDDEKIVQQMTEQFDNKAELQTAYNLKQFDKMVDELKKEVRVYPDLFLYSNEAALGVIDVFEFVGSMARIEVNHHAGALRFISYDFNIMNYDVRNNFFDSDTIKFQKFYKAEIERQLARKEKAKGIEKNERSLKSVRKSTRIKR